MARIIALSAFRQLGYTQPQAEQLEAAAANLAAATGISLDRAETDIRDLAETLGPKPVRYPVVPAVRSGEGW
jgi:hypothetical protein